MKPFSSVLCGAFLILSMPGFGQGIQPVRWHFQWEPAPNQEITLILTANVAPGWHVYSQFMEEGGPMPTRFSFDRSDDYIPSGKIEEKGNPVKFHDDSYEMEIIWYTGEVSFLQRIRLSQPEAKVNGVVEYMACNDHICVPRKQDFNFIILPLKKSP
jgi:DsbC/DsbD-like thiol-disulfide interchange protein